MAVEGKTILQTTERTELTGKEGIPFQEGTQNGHMLLEKIKEYIQEGSSNNSVHLFKGVCDIDKSSNPAEIKEALGVDSVNDLMTLAQKGTVFVDETNDCRYNTCSVYVLNNVIMISWLESEYPGLTNLKLNVSGSPRGDVFSFNSIEDLTVPLVEDNLNSEYPDSALSANQGRILNEKIAEISNPASAEKNGLMSKEDKAKVDGIQFNTNESSVWFNGKKYGAHIFKSALIELTTSSTHTDIVAALNGATFEDIKDYADRGILFFVPFYTILCPVTIGYSEDSNSKEIYIIANLGYNEIFDVQIDAISSSAYKATDGRFSKILYDADINNTLTSSLSNIPLSAAMGKKLQDEKLAKTDVVNNLTTADASKALSAAQGKALNDKIADFQSEISALKEEIEALKGSGT